VTEPRLIIRLAARGDGVTDDGRFVDGAVPGDVVRFTPDGPVVQPGPHHVVPPCRHFPECGGCQVQHVGDQAYADWVAARIVHAVESAGVSIGAVEPTHLSPPNTRRRASMRAVRRGRQVLLGFNTEGTHQIVDMQECHILLPRLFALVAPLRELLVHVAAEGKAIGVVLTDSDAGVDLLLTNVEARSLTAIERLTAFASDRKLARLSVESSAGIEVIAEPRTPTVRLGDVPVALPPASFLQATLDGEAALQAAVLSATAGAKSVADLFCGLGTFALPASRTARVFAADSAGPATQALAAAAKSAGPPRSWRASTPSSLTRPGPAPQHKSRSSRAARSRGSPPCRATRPASLATPRCCPQAATASWGYGRSGSSAGLLMSNSSHSFAGDEKVPLQRRNYVSVRRIWACVMLPFTLVALV
jgi:23S rRNA (uracil1939-C5)-methyltransferase